MKLKFKLADKKDLHSLDKIRGEKLHKLHLKRINQQKENKAIYFIVFGDKKPVGHIFINLSFTWHNYPILEDLYVKESERGKDVAKKIIIYSEKKLKQLHFKKIGIDVETHEKWIKEFYENMGFVRVGKPHTSSYILEDLENKKVTEKLFHLKKKI